MLLPKGTLIAVMDGENFLLFENIGLANEPKLSSRKAPKLTLTNMDGGKRHHTNTGRNPTDNRLDEDAHAAAVVDWLNAEAYAGKFEELVIVADPRSLGEMRLKYNSELKSKLRGELDLDLVNSTVSDIEKALVRG